jgi:Porin subfamily
MKMVKSLLLGTAAGLVAMTGAQAADLPVKAKPVQYVKICSLYGAGFYYIPGTDTCIKVGGFVRAEVNFGAGGSYAPIFTDRDTRGYNSQNWRSRAGITADARSQTAYGTLRAYVYLAATSTNSAAGNAAPSNANNGTGASAYTSFYAPVGFIQWAGFTAGKTASFFDFDGQPYSNQSNVWSSNNGGNGVDLWAYTAQLGNGLSASIAAENNNGHRLGVGAVPATTFALNATTGATASSASFAAETAGGQAMPDIVGNLRIDQAWGSAQVMAAAHQVNFGGQADPSDKIGYALGAGLKVNLPMIGKGDYIQGQFTYGKGAIDYVGSGLAQTQTVKQSGTTAYGPGWDAVVTGAGAADLTTGWSVTGGFEHFWVPAWKTSLFGSYGKLEYSTAASAAILAGVTGTTAGSSANWSFWQVGTRTTWTPVANLDLSVEVMYQNQDTAFAGAAVGDLDWWSGMFRAQRNFYP